MDRTCQLRRDVITTATTLTDTTYGGWMAINSGNTVAYVFGVELQPGERLDYHDIAPDYRFTSPFPIDPNGGQVTLLRMIYNVKK